LRRNPFIGIACGSKKKGAPKEAIIVAMGLQNIKLPTPVFA
jgi:hypothetical protein